MADPRDNLKPFVKGGPNPNRIDGRGRPSPLSRPEFVEEFAAHLTSGATQAAIAEAMDISDRSVRTYKNDPRVRAEAMRLTRERVIRITRKTDSEIERRLQYASDMTVEELIKIRRELASEMARFAPRGEVDAGTISETLDELDKSPELVEELSALLERASSKQD